MAAQRIVILGGTGFVGRHLLARLSVDGHRLIVLTRQRASHRALSVLPGVELQQVDVYDDAALRQALLGADAVINLIGILNPSGKQTFQRVHVELPRRLLQFCQELGIERLHQMSALKAGQGLSRYLKSRGEAEALMRASNLNWTIYQPSVIFGEHDGLVSRFNQLLKLMPVFPLARAGSRMAPTYVGDVVAAIARCVSDARLGERRSFELYGPEVLTLRQIVQAIADVSGRRRSIIALPDSLGRLQAQFASLLPGKPFSPDNFLTLRTDSVGKQDGYAALGIQPQSFSTWLPRLLRVQPRQPRLDDARRSQRRR